MKLTISPRRTALLLGLIVLVLFGAFFIKPIVETIWQLDRVHGLLRNLILMFDAGNESSIPTWYSSVALLLCSVLLATIAAAKKFYGGRYTSHWGGLSIIFLLLSIDEVAVIHENVGGGVGWYLLYFIGYTATGFLYYAWVVAGAVFVLIVLLTYLRFLFHLPKKTLLLFLCSGAVFAAGALGLEMIASQEAFIYSSGATTLEGTSDGGKRITPWIAPIEEGLEMLGVVIFIYALLSYMSSYVKNITVEIRTNGE